VPFECLALEITESLLVGDAPLALALLERIVDAGICLDLDDFGTGYSSLSYLHRFPFRSIKIDQSFVRQMNSDAKSLQLVAAIVGLARSLKMAVIAEGVENEDQMEKLCDMGCAVAQGYLFSPPLPASELEAFLRYHKNRPVPPKNGHVFRFPAPDTQPVRTPSSRKKRVNASVDSKST
jgi:EAL domain-containing protein (putative c-di-GMP-specific phosphodiesterase class I)